MSASERVVVACGLGLTTVFTVSLFGQPVFGIPVLLAPLGFLVARHSRRDAVAVLTVYVLLLIFIPSPLIIEPLGASGTPANLLGIFMLWWWLFSRSVDGYGVATGPSPVRTMIYIFGGAVMASYATVAFRPVFPEEVSAADRGVLFFLGCAGIALLATDGIATRDRLDALLRRLVMAVGALAAIGVYQFFTGFDINGVLHIPGLTQNQQLIDIGTRSIFNRVAGTAAHPIEFGVVLGVVFPIALHYAFYAPRATRARWWFAVGLIALGIPMSLSRSAVVSIGVAMAVLLPTWPKERRKRAIQVGFVFGVLTRFAIPGLLGTVKSLFLNIANDPSTTGRTQDYAVLGSYLQDHIIFGRGFFTFLPTIYTTFDNEYLLILVEMGIVGVCVLLGLFLTGMCSARAARHAAADAETRHLGQALAAALAAALVAFGTFDGLSFPMASGTVFLILGATGALRRLTFASNPARPRAHALG
jgi:O-antigen ligase